jgi:demethylmenaquinone methyltransferase / 2-methoxy-6-polyprenyl-1,4-benzoquinol methylase
MRLLCWKRFCSTTSHNEVVRREYAKQVTHFGAEKSLMSHDYTDNVALIADSVESALNAPLGQVDNLIEVAAGTGIVSRALVCAGVQRATALDITPAMLERGKHLAASQDGIAQRMQWVCGDALSLPFDDNTFDVAVCRWVLHHVERPEKMIAEMARVSRRLVVAADCEVPENAGEAARTRSDALETLRDPSHTAFPPPMRVCQWMQDNGLDVVDRRCVAEDRQLQRWMDASFTPHDLQRRIVDAMQRDVAASGRTSRQLAASTLDDCRIDATLDTATGLFPYIDNDDNNQLHFTHFFNVTVGKKKTIE